MQGLSIMFVFFKVFRSNSCRSWSTLDCAPGVRLVAGGNALASQRHQDIRGCQQIYDEVQKAGMHPWVGGHQSTLDKRVCHRTLSPTRCAARRCASGATEPRWSRWAMGRLASRAAQQQARVRTYSGQRIPWVGARHRTLGPCKHRFLGEQ
jgi:hypothetical protein